MFGRSKTEIAAEARVQSAIYNAEDALKRNQVLNPSEIESLLADKECRKYLEKNPKELEKVKVLYQAELSKISLDLLALNQNLFRDASDSLRTEIQTARTKAERDGQGAIIKTKVNLENPAILRCVSMGNNLAEQVKQEIMSHDTPEKRALALERWVQITNLCYKKQNIELALVLVNILNSSTIQGLKATVGGISDDARKNLEATKAALAPFGGRYEQALSEMSKLNQEQPIVPYIGQILSKLTFDINEKKSSFPDQSLKTAEEWLSQFDGLDKPTMKMITSISLDDLAKSKMEYQKQLIQQYLQAFPDGPELKEAKRVLDEWDAKLLDPKIGYKEHEVVQYKLDDVVNRLKDLREPRKAEIKTPEVLHKGKFTDFITQPIAERKPSIAPPPISSSPVLPEHPVSTTAGMATMLNSSPTKAKTGLARQLAERDDRKARRAGISKTAEELKAELEQFKDEKTKVSTYTTQQPPAQDPTQTQSEAQKVGGDEPATYKRR